MVNKILKFADEQGMFPCSGLVLLCVSGGADSMCMLDVALEISELRGFEIRALHYNHMLRGDESFRDELFVRDYCKTRGVELSCETGDVKSYANARRLGIEEAARDMRYGFFHEIASKSGASAIATAHTSDDNAETMLLNFLRGAGTAGLSGIPPVRGIIIRPMLCVSRDDVMEHVSNRSIPYVNDSSNSLDIYARNKIRHMVIPVLKELNPRFVEAATAAASIMRSDDEYLSRAAAEYIENKCIGKTTNAAELAALPFAVSSRVIKQMCPAALSYKHVKSVVAMCLQNAASACISLPKITVHKEYDRLVFGCKCKELDAAAFDPVKLIENKCVEVPGIGFKISCKSVICNDIMISKGVDGEKQKRNASQKSPFNSENDAPSNSISSFLFKKSDVCGTIIVRPRAKGDTIKLLGRKETKTLKKLFIEYRVPAGLRSMVPVIADEAGVLGIYGIGAGDRAAAICNDAAIQIDFTPLGS